MFICPMWRALVDIPLTDRALLLAIHSQSPGKREAAWWRFEALYGPVILSWCWWRLPPELKEDARDLTQDILLKLSVKFLQHCYDPARGRFRSWLAVTVRHAVTDYRRKRQGQIGAGAVGGTDHWRMLADLASREAADQLRDAITNQPATRAAQAIVARVRANVPERHWKAFCLYHFEERPAKEVAAELGLEVANVHKILQRIRKKLEEEKDHG
jgi:RNA polymerase sigma factor (sigma-70 family)